MVQSLIKITIGTTTSSVNDRWEMFLDYIKENVESNLIDIPDTLAYSSEFDLYAIFYREKIPERYHYPMMRLNGFRSPCDYKGDINKIRLYEPGALETVYKTYIMEK